MAAKYVNTPRSKTRDSDTLYYRMYFFKAGQFTAGRATLPVALQRRPLYGPQGRDKITLICVEVPAQNLSIRGSCTDTFKVHYMCYSFFLSLKHSLVYSAVNHISRNFHFSVFKITSPSPSKSPDRPTFIAR